MPERLPDVWIFGYGSLMWNPGFAYAEARHARLDGYHRAFCIYSLHYRGSPTRPGLVLGLDRGGSCDGIAFRLAPETAAATLAYIRARELIYSVYRESLLPITILAKDALRRPAMALTYIAERAHPAYAGRMPLARQVALIRGAQGDAGTNLDYAANTLAHLASLGIQDRRLSRVLTAASPFMARRCVSAEECCARSAALTRSWAQRPIERPHSVREQRFRHRIRLTGSLPRRDAPRDPLSPEREAQ